MINWKFALFFIGISFFNIYMNFAQTIDLTTLNKCEPKVMKMNNSELFLGATGIYKYNNKQWVDISNNINSIFVVDDIVFSKKHIIIKTSSGIFSSGLNNYKWTEHKQFSNNSHHLIETNDSLYLVCSSGIYIFNDESERFVAIQIIMPVKSVISALHFKNKIWVTNWRSGIWNFSLKTKQWSKVGKLSNEFMKLYKTKDNIYVNRNGYYKYVESDSLKWVRAKIPSVTKLKFEDKKTKIEIYNNSILYPSFTVYKDKKQINIRNKISHEISDIYYLDSMFIIYNSYGVYSYNIFDDVVKDMNTGIHNFAYRKYFTDGENAIMSYDEIGSNLFITYNKGKEWIDLNKTYNISNSPRFSLKDVIKTNNDIHLILSEKYYIINIKERKPKLIIDSLELFNIISVNDSIILIGSNKGILRTIDKGVNWGFTYNLEGKFNDGVYSIKSFNDILLANINHRKLIISFDKGRNWKEIKAEKKKRFGLFVTKDNVFWYSVFGEVSKTNDFTNWTKIPYSNFIHLNSVYINGYLIKRLKNGNVYMLKDNSQFVDKKFFLKNAVKVPNSEPNALSIYKFNNKLFILYKNKIQGYDVK